VGLIDCSNASCSNSVTVAIPFQTGVIGFGDVVVGSDNYPFMVYGYNYQLTPFVDADVIAVKCNSTTCHTGYTGGINLGSEGHFFNNVYAANYNGKSITVSNFDLAEDYLAEDQSITAGDVVGLTAGKDISVSKTSSSYAPNVIGVVSTKPGLRLSGWEEKDDIKKMIPVALAGRVPVKVTTENGPIKRGDMLVPASKPGYAMKACGEKTCQKGLVIGIAMEDFGANQNGDSIQVTQEIQETKAKVNNEIEIIQENLKEYELSATGAKKKEINEQFEKTEAITEITEKLTKPMAANYGEGRVMMFVNLTYHDPKPATPNWSLSADQIPSGNLTIDGSITAKEGQFMRLNIGQGKVEILDTGDINIFGTTTTKNLTVNALFTAAKSVIQDLQIDRLTLNTKNTSGDASTGSSTIKASSTKVTIENSSVKKNSRVLLTARTKTSATLAVTNIIEGNSFDVEIASPDKEDINFDYWIIQTN